MKKDIVINSEEKAFEWFNDKNQFHLSLEDEKFELELVKILSRNQAIIRCQGKNHRVWYASSSECSYIALGDHTFRIENKSGRKKKGAEKEGGLNSPMPGKILKVMVKKGDDVTGDTPLMIMEAMKMEHTIKSGYSGKVQEVFFSEGDLVEGGVLLLDVENLESKENA